MIPALMASAALLQAAPNELPSAPQLPYASTQLIFQSTDAVQRACAAFEASADTDLNRFVQLSHSGDYTAAYQIWSDLLFRYFSFKLELGQTQGLSLSEAVKASVAPEGERLEKTFQQKLTSHPDLLNTFLQNAEASSSLTPQQRLFTVNILKEYQDMHLQEEPQIAAALQKLSAEKTESFHRSQGLAAPINPDTLSELKVLTANIICFPGTLPYMYGGISPWKERIDKLVDTLRASDAQIVCLQEVWDPEAMRALAERLKESYAFFVYDAGDPAGTLQVKKMGYSSGLFLASKLPLDSVAFNRFPRSIPEGSNRGALIVTASVAQKHFALINTHLQHGNTLQMRQVRQEQLFLCYAALQEVISRTLPSNSWGCLAGDLNIDAFLPEFNENGLSRLFSIPYTEQLSNAKATCTGYFNDLVVTPLDRRPQVPLSYELLDYCVRPTLSTVDARPEQVLIPLYDISNPMSALSDHQALLTTWAIPNAKNSQTTQAAHRAD